MLRISRWPTLVAMILVLAMVLVGCAAPTPTAAPPTEAPTTTPVIARMTLTVVPMPTEMNGLTLGSVVLKLLAAMKAEKQTGGNAAMASRNITHLALSGPSTVGMSSKELRLSLFAPGS